jgi:hypothetical protein
MRKGQKSLVHIYLNDNLFTFANADFLVVLLFYPSGDIHLSNNKAVKFC